VGVPQRVSPGRCTHAACVHPEGRNRRRPCLADSGPTSAPTPGTGSCTRSGRSQDGRRRTSPPRRVVPPRCTTAMSTYGNRRAMSRTPSCIDASPVSRPDAPPRRCVAELEQAAITAGSRASPWAHGRRSRQVAAVPPWPRAPRSAGAPCRRDRFEPDSADHPQAPPGTPARCPNDAGN